MFATMSALTALKKSFQENYGTVQEASSSDTSEETAADDVAPAVGELALEEDAAGGLGRHLGLFSTTFLMQVRSKLAFDACCR